MKNFKTTLLALSVCSLGLSSAHATTDASSRIINGSQSGSDSWPFMTALVFKNVNAYDGQFCGASYIGGKYVLTAAHCVEEFESLDFDVVVGTSNLSASDAESSRYSVEQVYIHSSYESSPNIKNDLAILELSNVPDARSITTADRYLRNNLESGEVLTVMGWGDQNADPDVYSSSNHLFEVDVPLVEQSTCTGLGGDYASIGEDAFCAGYPEGGKDSCQGDSGGPIVVKNGDEYEQLGVVSWGIGCAQEGAYGVYANVSYFSDWISSMTEGFSFQQNERVGAKLAGQHTHAFSVTNNTQQPVSVTQITAVTTDTSIQSNTCSTPLSVGASCEINISYMVDELDFGEAKISVLTDHGNLSDIEMKVTYVGVKAASSNVADQVSIQHDDVYTTQHEWQEDNGDLVSSNKWDNTESKLVVTGIPTGTLTLNLDVSSEESFDVLNIYSNAWLVDSVSGEFTGTIRVPLLRDNDNSLLLEYKKDGLFSAGDDRALVSGFSHSDAVSISKSNGSNVAKSGSSGGGLGWFVPVVLLFLANRRRK
ncbi:S1 family peptidase [Vibrio profundi]|uniref:S1 family peptidase n=1 Tax=Vibrio profundi TaxID=1774960 RepID=UPI0037370D3B